MSFHTSALEKDQSLFNCVVLWWCYCTVRISFRLLKINICSHWCMIVCFLTINISQTSQGILDVLLCVCVYMPVRSSSYTHIPPPHTHTYSWVPSNLALWIQYLTLFNCAINLPRILFQGTNMKDEEPCFTILMLYHFYLTLHPLLPPSLPLLFFPSLSQTVPQNNFFPLVNAL